MLTFRLLREDLVPTVQEIDTFNFVSGEKRTLAIQLLNSYDKNPLFVATGFTVRIEMQTADPESPVIKTMALNATDKSIATVELSQSETETIISGKLIVSITEDADATNVQKAIKKQIFTRNKPEC